MSTEVLCCNLDNNASRDAIGKDTFSFEWSLMGANRYDRRTYRRESRIKNVASRSIIRGVRSKSRGEQLQR